MLTRLLEQVSRSFYLTLRVLPASIRPQIGLAYLLARTTDTIADTAIVPLERRLAMLESLRARILDQSNVPLNFADLLSNQGSAGERVLLEQVETSLKLLAEAETEDRRLICDVLEVITSGQVLDLKRFANASGAQIAALQTAAELDDYTYRVAGCVGEFWTRICLKNQFGGEAFLKRQTSNAAEFEAWGVRFGKGLQLVNILRDLPADLRNGRCYVPMELLASTGLQPRDLLARANEPQFRPVYDRMLDSAEAHLKAGWRYTNLIPRGEMRLRLACAWPILIGLQTVERLRHRGVLDPALRIKISRKDVRGILIKSILLYPFPAWKRMVPH
jgi:farnesyl-diphosphate farnesyltransferase